MRCTCCDDFMRLHKTYDNSFASVEIYICSICDKSLKIEKNYYGGFEITINPSEYESQE